MTVWHIKVPAQNDFLLAVRRLETSLYDVFRYSSGSVEGGYHHHLLIVYINGATDQLIIFAAFDIMELKVCFGGKKHYIVGLSDLSLRCVS